MPPSTRDLYTHLVLEADDDGFVSPKMVMRTLNSTEDDLRLLIAKGFVLWFPSNVVVITHWNKLNKVTKDRYEATDYQEELDTLTCVQNVYILDTQGRLELGKERVVGESQRGEALKAQDGDNRGDKGITALKQGIMDLVKDKRI